MNTADYRKLRQILAGHPDSPLKREIEAYISREYAERISRSQRRRIRLNSRAREDRRYA